MSIITLSCHKRTPLSHKLTNYYAIKTITFLERSLWMPEHSAHVTTALSLSLRASSSKQSQHSAHESHLTHITVLITLQVHFPYACKQDVWPSKCFAIITAKWNKCSQWLMLSKLHEGRKYIHKKGCTKLKNCQNMWVWQPLNLSLRWRHTDNRQRETLVCETQRESNLQQDYCGAVTSETKLVLIYSERVHFSSTWSPSSCVTTLISGDFKVSQNCSNMLIYPFKILFIPFFYYVLIIW